MPRKRRPTPPLPGSIVRNIAPKPDLDQHQDKDTSDTSHRPESTSSKHSTAGSEVETTSCGVPQCKLVNCKLPTHLSYGRQRRLALLHSRRDLGRPHSPSGHLSEATSALNIQQGMEGKVKLPLEDTPDRDLVRLFIQFFQNDFDRLALIFRPQRRDPVLKHSSYRLALHNPIYCLTLIAQAHMININDNFSPSGASTDPLTDVIYSTLLKMTREKIESFDLGDVDVLLLAIVALCQYDLQLDRYEALRSHHIGMTALVSKRGGIHNLGLSLPYVLRMDRFLAIRGNEMPQFGLPELHVPDIIMQQPTDSVRYGSVFRRGRSTLSDEVRFLCSSAAHLLDLMDELNVTFDPAKLPGSLHPKLEYLYFLRENVEVRHAILNYQYTRSAQSVNKDLLVLTATKIVEYYVCSANYLPIVTETLSTRLWNMLTKAPVSNARPQPAKLAPERGAVDSSYIPTINLAEWTNCMPMLLWLLFACALPKSRGGGLSFAGRLASAPASSAGPDTLVTSASVSHSQTSTGVSKRGARQAIVSPSSPRRQRYLPNFILHVAEHLVGERPLSGTSDWDRDVTTILEGFVWSSRRLDSEFQSIVGRMHENVLARADDGT